MSDFMKLLKSKLFVLLMSSLLSFIGVISAHAETAKVSSNTREFTRWDYYSYRYVGEKINRIVLPAENFRNCKPCKLTNADSRKSSAFHSIRAKAFEEIKKFGRQGAMPLPVISWNFTQSVQPDLKKVMIKLNEQAMKYWSSSMNSDVPYMVIVGEEKSRSELAKVTRTNQEGWRTTSSF